MKWRVALRVDVSNVVVNGFVSLCDWHMGACLTVVVVECSEALTAYKT